MSICDLIFCFLCVVYFLHLCWQKDQNLKQNKKNFNEKKKIQKKKQKPFWDRHNNTILKDWKSKQ